MASFMTAREIAEHALRKIGAYTVNDSGADGNELDVALSALDVVLAHHLSVDRFWFLVDAVYTVSLTADQTDYDLKSELGSSWPSDGIIFPIAAHLADSNGNIDPVTILRRDQWDELDTSESGRPGFVYFDRSDPTTMTMRIYPTIGTSGFSIKLTAQSFAKTVSGPLVNPTVATGLPQAWNMWAIYQLAVFCGDGTIRRVSSSYVKEWKDEAEMLKHQLESFAAQEHADDPVAEPYDLADYHIL